MKSAARFYRLKTLHIAAIFAVGATSFIFQHYYEETWAKNTMMQVLIDDLDGAVQTNSIGRLRFAISFGDVSYI